MLLFLSALFLFILATPVYAHIEAVADEEMAGTVTLQLLGIKKKIHMKKQKGKAFMSLLDTGRMFMRANHAKRLLCLSVHVVEIRADIRIGLSDAAKTVLACAVARELAAFLSQWFKSRRIEHLLCVQANFSFAGCAMRFRGILFARLGNLLVLGVMALILAKEAKRWNTRLET